MSDSIIDCKLHKNSDESIRGYEVTFLYDGLDVPITWNPIYISGQSLINPVDLNEVKRVACQHAKEIKDMYSNTTIITDLNGPVTL